MQRRQTLERLGKKLGMFKERPAVEIRRKSGALTFYRRVGVSVLTLSQKSFA
jgi:hypothetical protein